MQPLRPPLDLSSAWEAGGFDDLAGYHENKLVRQRYGRDSSSVVMEAEKALEAYHPGYRALLFGSGMSACSAVLDIMDGPLWLPRECYRKMDWLASRHKANTYQRVSDIDPGGTIWAESPSNPHLRLADYKGLKSAGESRVILDLTLASLGNWNQAETWPAAIIHSATKYVGGHNDFLAGVAFVRPEYYGKLWDRRSAAGGILDPMSAWLLLRSLLTYDLRLERQVRNTEKVLAALKNMGRHVFYPWDVEPWHRHGGAVISFLAEGSPKSITDRCGAMKTCRMAPSFGSVVSLIESPATMSRYGVPEEQLLASGIEPNLVRLAVGIEPAERIIADVTALC